MLCGETVSVYYENHTEHTDTVRTSQETHYVSATQTNRLMLLGETVAVYCENHTEHTNTLCGQNAKFHHVKGGGTYSNHRESIYCNHSETGKREYNTENKHFSPLQQESA
jgi:hypothetical protein